MNLDYYFVTGVRTLIALQLTVLSAAVVVAANTPGSDWYPKKKLNMTNRLSPSRIVPQDPKTLEPRKAFAPDAVFFARLVQTCKPEPTDLKNELLKFQLPVLSL